MQACCGIGVRVVIRAGLGLLRGRFQGLVIPTSGLVQTNKAACTADIGFPDYAPLKVGSREEHVSSSTAAAVTPGKALQGLR